jgi:hypothetical protein
VIYDAQSVGKITVYFPPVWGIGKVKGWLFNRRKQLDLDQAIMLRNPLTRAYGIFIPASPPTIL